MKKNNTIRVKIISDQYVGAYEIDDEFDVLEVYDDGAIKIIDNDGKFAYLWSDEFEIIT